MFQFRTIKVKLKDLEHLRSGQYYYSTRSKLKEYARCYSILEIPNGSDQEAVRRAFINLCKKYHPDSGNPLANEEKFHEVRFFFSKNNLL